MQLNELSSAQATEHGDTSVSPAPAASASEQEPTSAPLPKVITLTSAPLDPIESLLGNILSSFGQGKKAQQEQKLKEKKAKAQAKVDEISSNTIAENFGILKTGYKTWTAIARQIVFQEVECRCCGRRQMQHMGELFKYENGQSHSTWYRPEGYGIEELQSLPLEFHSLPELKLVTACPECKDIDPELALAGKWIQLEIVL
jgi:hypothetical protein